MGIVLMKVESVYDTGSGILNEDALLIKRPVFGVFDGASSLVPYKSADGKTGAYLAANIAREIFASNNKPLEELAKEANQRIKEAMDEANIDTTMKENLWGTTAAVVKIGKDTFDYLQITDSLILVIYEDKSYKLVAGHHDHDKELLTKWRALADKKTKNIRQILNNDVIELRKTSNIAYGTINGEKEMLKFLHTGTESLQNVKHIILFTDGLIVPKENPQAKDDFDTFAKLYLEGGLEQIKRYVRELENNDPDCWKYPRYKQHDDMAAISISF